MSLVDLLVPRKNDVLSAFRKRWVHSFNTAAPGHVVEAWWAVGGRVPKLPHTDFS